MKPANRRPIVTHLMTQYQISERRSCELVGLSRSSFRYKSLPKNDDVLRARLKTLAATHMALGYPMLHGMLKAEGLVMNPKHTYRLYREEGLQVRMKKRKKLKRPRLVMETPTGINQRWSMDFVSDQLFDGRRFRVLNIVDDYSREMVGQLVASSITGQRVASFLDQLIEQRGKPTSIVCDNGTEFTSKAMFFWGDEKQVRLAFIQPGKPTQNAFVESLNGKFRNECVNQHWFRNLHDAEQKIAAWRHYYNTVRPHSSLKYMTPVAFAKKAA